MHGVPCLFGHSGYHAKRLTGTRSTAANTFFCTPQLFNAPGRGELGDSFALSCVLFLVGVSCVCFLIFAPKSTSSGARAMHDFGAEVFIEEVQ